MISNGPNAPVDRVLLKNTLNAKVDDDVLFTMPDDEMTYSKALFGFFPLAGAALVLLVINTFFKDFLNNQSTVAVFTVILAFVILKFLVNKKAERELNERKSQAKLVSIVKDAKLKVIA